MQSENEALADRLEEAALASLPFGSGELAEALAEANVVRRGESSLLAGSGPTGWNLAEACRPATEQATQSIARDARIARAAEGLLAAMDAAVPGWRDKAVYVPEGPDSCLEAWDRLVEAVEGGAGEAPAEGGGE